jgi:hypothetical protein
MSLPNERIHLVLRKIATAAAVLVTAVCLTGGVATAATPSVTPNAVPAGVTVQQHVDTATGSVWYHVALAKTAAIKSLTVDEEDFPPDGVIIQATTQKTITSGGAADFALTAYKVTGETGANTIQLLGSTSTTTYTLATVKVNGIARPTPGGIQVVRNEDELNEGSTVSYTVSLPSNSSLASIVLRETDTPPDGVAIAWTSDITLTRGHSVNLTLTAFKVSGETGPNAITLDGFSGNNDYLLSYYAVIA